eukprot:3644998-Alexandrium_andersonii.AAC.1
MQAHPLGVPRTVNGIASLTSQDQAYVTAALEQARQAELNHPEGVVPVLPTPPATAPSVGTSTAEEDVSEWWDSISWD